MPTADHADEEAPARRCIWCRNELSDEEGPFVDIVTGLEFCGANPDRDRHEPEFRCPTCGDEGSITFYHPSFDYPTGGEPCPDLNDPVKHPPPPPPPVSLVKPHKCSGPLCCPPF